MTFYGKVDHVIEGMSSWSSVRLRHESAPLLKEREQYLSHLLQMGFCRESVRSTAAYLIHVVRVMNMFPVVFGKKAQTVLACCRYGTEI